jgi:PAS domain-containing protein
MPGTGGNRSSQSSRVLRLDGTVRWVTERGQFYYAADGEAERMLGMAVDITERKLAEEALQKSEEKFSKAFRESPMALAVTRVKDYRYLDINLRTNDRLAT